MAKRQVLHIDGLIHDNPIPAAVKIGNMIFTSAIIGTSPATGLIPDLVEDEIANLFHYLTEIMVKAGGSTDDIAHVKILVSDPQYKKYINPQWVQMFPDENNCPARHTTVGPLKEGIRVQIEMTAVL